MSFVVMLNPPEGEKSEQEVRTSFLPELAGEEDVFAVFPPVYPRKLYPEQEVEIPGKEIGIEITSPGQLSREDLRKVWDKLQEMRPTKLSFRKASFQIEGVPNMGNPMTEQQAVVSRASTAWGKLSESAKKSYGKFIGKGGFLEKFKKGKANMENYKRRKRNEPAENPAYWEAALGPGMYGLNPFAENVRTLFGLAGKMQQRSALRAGKKKTDVPSPRDFAKALRKELIGTTGKKGQTKSERQKTYGTLAKAVGSKAEARAALKILQEALVGASGVKARTSLIRKLRTAELLYSRRPIEPQLAQLVEKRAILRTKGPAKGHKIEKGMVSPFLAKTAEEKKLALNVTGKTPQVIGKQISTLKKKVVNLEEILGGLKGQDILTKFPTGTKITGTEIMVNPFLTENPYFGENPFALPMTQGWLALPINAQEVGVLALSTAASTGTAQVVDLVSVQVGLENKWARWGISSLLGLLASYSIGQLDKPNSGVYNAGGLAGVAINALIIGLIKGKAKAKKEEVQVPTTKVGASIVAGASGTGIADWLTVKEEPLSDFVTQESIQNMGEVNDYMTVESLGEEEEGVVDIEAAEAAEEETESVGDIGYYPVNQRNYLHSLGVS